MQIIREGMVLIAIYFVMICKFRIAIYWYGVQQADRTIYYSST